MNPEIDKTLERIDYGLAGATGFAISLNKPIHAVIFALMSLVIALIRRTRSNPRRGNDVEETKKVAR